MPKEKVKKAGPVKGSVRDKKLAIEAETKKIGAGVKGLLRDIEAQKKENQEAVVRIKVAVKKFQGDIEAQKKENQEAVKNMEVGVKRLQKDFKAKKGEFSNYTKAFWG